MLKLTLKAGQYMKIGDEIKVVYTGGGVGNAQFLVEAPKSMNILRSNVQDRNHPEIAPEPGGKYYTNQGISDEARMKIQAILAEERRKDKTNR